MRMQISFFQAPSLMLFLMLMLPQASQLQPRVLQESSSLPTGRSPMLELKRAFSDPAESLASWQEESAGSGFCRGRGVACNPAGAAADPTLVTAPDLSGLNLSYQAAALLAFRQNLSDPQAHLASWSGATDCCSWVHVSCDLTASLVTALDLSGLSLIFSRHDWFASLTNLSGLVSLNLSFNNFSSLPIPAGFVRLPRLAHLNISNAGFSGRIPPELGRIRTLVSLDLSFSILFTQATEGLRLDDSGFFADLPELEVLYLDEVNLSSSLRGMNCRALSSGAPKLRVVSLSRCSVNCPLDTLVNNLSRGLTYLRLDGNNFASRVPDSLSNFSSLADLRLSSCGLVGEFPESIFRLKSLRILYVTLNPNLTGRLPEFPEDSSLQELFLTNTNFSGELPSSIGNLASLTRLRLTGSNFSGKLPVGVGKLVRLEYLDLSSNRFTGKVPSLARLVQLVRLDLSSNNFTGTIPDVGDNLPRLVDFNLRYNSLNGSIPRSLFALPSLQILLLNQNKLNGEIHEFVAANGSSLASVDLGNNNLQGAFPKSISELRKLKALVLSSNNFSGVVKLDMFENVKNLSRLDLSDSGLSVQVGNGNLSNFPQIGTLKLGSCNLSKIPEFLQNQRLLAELDLSNNEIPGDIPNWIWNLESLNYLNLSNNKLEGPGKPLYNHSLSPLLLIDLHSNMFRGPMPLVPESSFIVDYSDNKFLFTIPPDIGGNLSFSIFLSLSCNNLNGSIPSSICSARNLKALDFSGNNLRGPIPPCLTRNLSGLNVLNLRENSISGSIPDTFSIECNLKTLDLNGNKLVGNIPVSLKYCTKLEVLNLGNNHIEGTFPSWLGMMPSLRVLVLRANHFQGLIEPYINPSFPMLQIIDLSSNNFSGNLCISCFITSKSMIVSRNEPGPRNQVIQSRLLQLTPLYYRDTVTVTLKGFDVELVKILTVFTSVDLSNNNFEGSIPEAIGNLSMLYVLNLSRNALTGPIPRSIGALRQLESLDLSDNKLSGEIPAELSQLTFLSVLNLSFNQLMGRIPQGQQLNTFTNSSYLHNVELCGPPLSKTCQDDNHGEGQDGLCTAQLMENCPDATPPKGRQNVDWEWIVFELGCVFGFGMVFLPLVLWRRWSRFYFTHVDRFLLKIFPSVFA